MNIARKLFKTLLRQQGGASVEFLIAAPALLLLGLGGMQTIFFHDAKTTLTYATFEAAREGAVTHAQTKPMRNELGVRLSPIFGGDGTASKALQAMAASTLEVNNPLFTKIEVLNPTQEAFKDFGVTNPSNNKKEIPNDNLKFRSREIGSTSGVNIQDANLLKVKVTYGYELKVPLINTLLPAAMKWIDPGNIAYYAAGRIPITAVATVRMQSPAWPDNNASTSGGGSVGGTPPDTTDPGESQPPGGDAENGDGDSSDGSNSEQGEEGTGTGSDDSNPGTGTDNDTGSGSDDSSGVGSDTGDTASGGQPEEITCEKTTPEEDNKGPDGEDQGFWGDLWDGIKDGLVDGYEFMKGFWEGIKDQIGDLANMILHPIDTANGLIALGKAFYDDPVGTAKMIGEALGEDWSKLTQCGAYDRGKVIGQYVNPAFMLKLATKLSKFGSLAKAIEETKKGLFKCASFGAGTQVHSTNGRVAIEQIGIGELVNSRYDVDFVDRAQQVTDVFGRKVDYYHILETEYDSFEVTEEHPFWVQGKGWIPVKEIVSGDAVATSYGDVLVLNNVRIDEPLEVFNFSVDATYSYFVGSGLWVHNANKCMFEKDLYGNSTRLKNRMTQAGMVIPPGYQAHHLVPLNVAKSLGTDPKKNVLLYATQNLMYGIDRPRNGIALPGSDAARLPGDTKPLHNTNHKKYDNLVKEKLYEINEQFKNGELTDEQIIAKVRALEDELREGIENGTITW